MTEQMIHAILLALHNIALVGCAAAPFYNANLVNVRAQYGPKLHYELDKVVEDTLQGNAPYCKVFMAVLVLTGVGIPLNHYFFHGSTAHMHMIGHVAFVLKMICVLGMIFIMMKIFSKINPELASLFSGFSPTEKPDPDNEKKFFILRAQRKHLCEICLYFAIGVLVFSAFLSFKL